MFLARGYFHHSFLWADEAARLALSILAFIGGAVAYRRRDHAFVRLVLKPRARARRARLPGAGRCRRVVPRRPDRARLGGVHRTLAPFRAKMEPAYKRIADCAGEANVKKFRDLVERGRKTG